MGSSEYILQSLSSMDRYVTQMAAVTGPEGFVNAVSEYLAAWTKDRIENLQKVDGGWGPFDDRQQLVQLRTVADVARICNSVHRQYIALKEAGISLTPELAELDLFLFFARQVIEDHEAIRSRPSVAASAAPGYRQSDSQALAVSF